MTLCTVCNHPEQAEVELALAGGTSARSVAKRFGLSRAAIGRHRETHWSPSLVATSFQAVTRSDELLPSTLARLEAKLADVDGALEVARTGRNVLTLLACVREARQCLEVIHKVQVQLAARPVVVDLLREPSWLRTRKALREVLVKFPEAAEAVAEVLAALEAEP